MALAQEQAGGHGSAQWPAAGEAPFPPPTLAIGRGCTTQFFPHFSLDGFLPRMWIPFVSLLEAVCAVCVVRLVG